MNEQEITKLFNELIGLRTAVKMFGLTKHQVTYYRSKSTPDLGTMLQLLYKAGKINIIANEPTTGTE
jgi:hypothetical protein